MSKPDDRALRIEALRQRHILSSRQVREMRAAREKEGAKPEDVYLVPFKLRELAAADPERYAMPLSAAELNELFDALPPDPREPGAAPMQEGTRSGWLSRIWDVLRGAW